MQGDDPPYLSVGTAVSAKYKGAFCEAKVSKVVRIVKCKVTYKMGLGTATVSDEHIKGTLRVGQLVQAKHPDKKDFIDATITKIQDCSQYTVVFDDGDITTLRRTALCLKSGRHFNESETLDQLPLTHPEHFGNPVVGGRRGRRSRQLKEDSSEGEIEEENEPDLELYSADIGRVVSVESSEKKRNKDNWFPGLIVMPSAQPTVKINVKDEFLVRSFKDGRYYTVPKKEVTEFTRELGTRVESSHLMEAVEKALKYLDEDELPVHWEKNSLFNTQSQYSDSEENFTDSSDDEPREEKDHFVAQLYKFMDDAGTPLKSPLINNKDVDLYRLFRVVQKLGGYNRVTNQNKWRSVASRLKFANNQNTSNQIKIVYRKCLYTYEGFYRTLGCTMSDHTRSTKKNRGRSLIRDKDRVTPVQSPRPDKEETEIVEKKEEDEKSKLRKPDVVKKDSDDEKKRAFENSESSSDNADISEPIASVSKEMGRPKRTDLVKTVKEKKTKIPVSSEKVKVAEKIEEPVKKEDKEDEKVQQTRSKAQIVKVVKDAAASPERKMREQKVLPQDPAIVNKIVMNKIPKRNSDEEKKRGRKRINAEEKINPDSNTIVETVIATPVVNIGDKLKVYYGPTHESKVTYEAKVIEIDRDQHEPVYLVHYTGWNTRYDEWIAPVRIAENLSATTKAKRLKQGSIVTAPVTTITSTVTVTKIPAVASTSATPSTNPIKVAGKRGRGVSITGKTTTTTDPPRSTTPSSVTSSSSRTKSPATPITRNNRITRQVSGELVRRTRRTSVQTDVSVQSDSDTVETESDSELSKTKSGSKIEGSDGKLVRKKLTKTKGEKRKDDEDTEKEDDSEKSKKIVRKVKKTPANVKPPDESDEDSTNPPKGRDFDLNQIRSELKGFTKIKMTSAENSSDKEIAATLSDEFTNVLEVKSLPEEEDEDDDVDKKDKLLESTSSSDDVYEFKEPEPFEFEKIIDDKSKKRLVPRVLETVEKSPKKKSPKMTTKLETKDADDKKRYKRTPVKKDDGDNLSDKEQPVKLVNIEDPFDKLVESPSFHIHKPALSDKKPDDFKKVVKALILDEPLNLFEELPMSVDEENVERLDISDSEDLQNEPFFTHKEQLFSTSTFSKESPDHNIDSDCVGFTPKSDDRKPTTSDDEDIIQATMQTVLTFDNDSNDTLLINQPSVSYEMLKRKESTAIAASQIESEDELKPPEIFNETKDTQEKIASLSRQLAPVFQETDSALLKDLCSQPTPPFLTKSEDVKDINVKTGTKIADTILQKLNMIKSKDCKAVVKAEAVIEKEEPPPIVESDVENIDVKSEAEEEDLKCNESIEMKVKSPEPKMKSVETKLKCEKLKVDHDLKRRQSRKVLSREFVDETDSDSSDSGERLIMDEDSQTSLSLDTIKPDVKECDSNELFLKADEQEIEESKHNFKFDYILQSSELKEEVNMETECMKEDEPDSHSLLLCEETIPGSPAPAPLNEVKQKMKNELEMPFASAPSSSNNNKNIIINEHKNINKERVIPPPLVVNLDNPENRDASAVLDNTPPTTPESTISNLSPRGENGGLSPNTADNESCKSTEAEGDYSNQRRISTSKISPYSEEDTLMNIESGSTKKRDEMVPSPCKKRRRSCKALDEIPAKRGRKPNNRSRHNSDSDDTSEHSAQGTTNISSTTSIESRLTRSPKPSKYNFYVEFDPSLDSAQRIAVLQQKLAELRKTYANVKAELATIERRRKKIRRRDREAAKAAKQEMTAACT